MSFSILVVDDEPDVADLFLQHFRREVRQGTYVVHFVGSGEEALQLLVHGIEPQLIVILSDINMPGMDGLTLLREIKRRRPDLPVTPWPGSTRPSTSSSPGTGIVTYSGWSEGSDARGFSSGRRLVAFRPPGTGAASTSTIAP